ncbi:kinesin motor domain protein (macronuclear) [Tetrahymena thermophila SB210]|uniref:Kinesin motor domain protein n=1 Tax=Tetrahymena thermophila (strain SB210) TaxID=312017 RepID=I7M142_TETTS|nr:kinesin motor domain protein [Tetrahymena thermophila SB210]EAR94202.2 kinesin motor domain protein [Tetrahymena thermophila SB210]|eukprot:XP_001014447.2 kinesin motor domain protein [Tetrahymena thermophila SB210]
MLKQEVFAENLKSQSFENSQQQYNGDEYDRIMRKYNINQDEEIQQNDHLIDKLKLNSKHIGFAQETNQQLHHRIRLIHIDTNCESNVSPTPSFQNTPQHLDTNFTKELLSSKNFNQQKNINFNKIDNDDAHTFKNSDYDNNQANQQNLAQSYIHESLNKTTQEMQVEEESIRQQVKLSEMNYKLTIKENQLQQIKKQVDNLEKENMSLKKALRKIQPTQSLLNIQTKNSYNHSYSTPPSPNSSFIFSPQSNNIILQQSMNQQQQTIQLKQDITVLEGIIIKKNQAINKIKEKQSQLESEIKVKDIMIQSLQQKFIQTFQLESNYKSHDVSQSSPQITPAYPIPSVNVSNIMNDNKYYISADPSVIEQDELVVKLLNGEEKEQFNISQKLPSNESDVSQQQNKNQETGKNEGDEQLQQQIKELKLLIKVQTENLHNKDLEIQELQKHISQVDTLNKTIDYQKSRIDQLLSLQERDSKWLLPDLESNEVNFDIDYKFQLEKTLKQYEQRIIILTNENDKLNQNLRKQEQQNDDLLEQIGDLKLNSRLIEEDLKQIPKLQQEIMQVQKYNKLLEHNIEQLEEKYSSIEKEQIEVEQLQKIIETLNQSLSEAKIKQLEVSQQLKDKDQQFQECQKKLDTLEREHSLFQAHDKNQIQHLQNIVIDYENRIILLSQEVDRLSYLLQQKISENESIKKQLQYEYMNYLSDKSPSNIIQTEMYSPQKSYRDSSSKSKYFD